MEKIWDVERWYCQRCKRDFYSEEALDEHWLKVHMGE